MGVTGPVPKRSEERIRRNKLDYEITKVEAAGAVEPPDLGIEDPHPIVQDLWKSMGESAQVKYFEPTDWAYARFVLHFANQQLKVSRPSGQILLWASCWFLRALGAVSAWRLKETRRMRPSWIFPKCSGNGWALSFCFHGQTEG